MSVAGSTGWTMGGKAPAPPDYTGAAQAQAQGSRENVIEQTFANRPNVNTPYGNITWNRPEYPGAPGYMANESGMGPVGAGNQGGMFGLGHPGLPPAVGGGGGGGGIPGGAGSGDGGGYNPGDWQMNLELPPDVLAALQAQQRIGLGRSEMGEQMLGSAGEDLQRGINWGGLPEVTGGEDARNAAEQALFGRYQSRLDPQWQQGGADLENKLMQQGLDPGTEAFTRAMGDFYRGKNDAYQTAMRESVTGGGAEASRQYQLDAANRARALQEQYQQQYGGINALNAFLQGQQVQMPQFPGFSQAGQAQAPQYLQAANLQNQAALQQYGLNQGGLQGFLGGLGNLGGMIPFL